MKKFWIYAAIFLLFIIAGASCGQTPTQTSPTPVPTRAPSAPPAQQSVRPTNTPNNNRTVNITERERIYYGKNENEYLRKITDGPNTCYFRNLGTANAVLSCVK